MTGRTPLNSERVVAGAVTLAAREGLEAVSMRRLASDLDVVPMALSKHVRNKEQLYDAMVASIIAEYGVAAGDGSPKEWREEVTRRTIAARSAVIRHPWARRAIESRTTRSPAVLGHMEALTSALLRGGFTPDLAHHVMHTLGNRIWGFSPELFPGESAPLDPTQHAGILRVAADAIERRGGGTCDEDFEFSFALDLILDGAERLRASRWCS